MKKIKKRIIDLLIVISPLISLVVLNIWYAYIGFLDILYIKITIIVAVVSIFIAMIDYQISKYSEEELRELERIEQQLKEAREDYEREPSDITKLYIECLELILEGEEKTRGYQVTGA